VYPAKARQRDGNGIDTGRLCASSQEQRSPCLHGTGRPRTSRTEERPWQEASIFTPRMTALLCANRAPWFALWAEQRTRRPMVSRKKQDSDSCRGACPARGLAVVVCRSRRRSGPCSRLAAATRASASFLSGSNAPRLRYSGLSHGRARAGRFQTRVPRRELDVSREKLSSRARGAPKWSSRDVGLRAHFRSRGRECFEHRRAGGRLRQ